jgi:hypothetical protein
MNPVPRVAAPFRSTVSAALPAPCATTTDLWRVEGDPGRRPTMDSQYWSRVTGGLRRTVRGYVSARGSLLLGLLVVAVLVSFARAAPNVYSDGSDGVLNPTVSDTIDLGLAVTGSWNQAGTGTGVYDPEKWAVVFKYSSVNIPTGKTLTFINHQSRAPVVWLVQGNITIAGTVSLNGNSGAYSGALTPAGPGGFPGGRGWHNSLDTGSAGLGPGGGGHSTTASGSGGYVTDGTGALGGKAYGNYRVLPLIGGSGGGGAHNSIYSGGGGGGAILLACTGTCSVTGTVAANGGSGFYGSGFLSSAGSGGAIRIIANQITGTAAGLKAPGGTGLSGLTSPGRIRIEANSISLSGASDPAYTWLQPLDNDEAVIWLPDTAPRVHVVSVGSQTVPLDPNGQFNPPGDVFLVTADPQLVQIEAANVPTSWLVKLRVIQRNGSAETLTATLVSGDDQASIWQVTLTGIPANDFVAVQARASAQ